MTGAALTHEPTAEVWEAADWKKLWLSACNKTTRWRTLAVVPAGPGISSELSLQFAVALAHAGSLHLGVQIDVANATCVEPAQVEDFSQELEYYLRERSRLVVALSAFSENAASLPLARAADVALLCVLLGAVSRPTAQDTVAQLGASHFVGSVALRLPPSAATVRGRAGAPPPLKPRAR